MSNYFFKRLVFTTINCAPIAVENALVNDMLVNFCLHIKLPCRITLALSSTPDVFQTNLNLMGFSQLATCSRAQLPKGPVRVEG